MKKLWLTIGLMTILVATGAVALWAQGAAAPAPGGTAAAGAGQPAPDGDWMAALTPQQKAQVQAKIDQMKQAGNTPQEITAALAEMLRAWGVETTGQKGPGPGEPPWMQQLTPDQRAQVVAKIKELKQAGDTPEQIHAAVLEMLKAWGIQPAAAAAGQAGAQANAQAAGQAGAPAGGGGPAWLAKLTPDQRQQLQAKVQQMRQAGATQPEIRAAIGAMLKGWGLQMPAQGNPLEAALQKLTPEQRQQVQATIQTLRADGATTEQIRAAVEALLKGWGIQVQAAGEGAPAQAVGEGGGELKAVLEKLTPEQRQQVLAKLKEMREQGKTPAEIHAAIAEMLKAWGVQIPVPPAAVQPEARAATR